MVIPESNPGISLRVPVMRLTAVSILAANGNPSATALPKATKPRTGNLAKTEKTNRVMITENKGTISIG